MTTEREKLKIASFRTKQGVWDDFTAKAQANGLTATDILKACMEQYLSGEYHPISTNINTPISTELVTRDEMQAAISTAINTVSIPTQEHLTDLINTLVSTTLDAKLEKALSQRQLPPKEAATGDAEDTSLRDGDEVQIVTNPTSLRSTNEPELSPLDSTETGTAETIMVTASKDSPRIDDDSDKVQTPSEVKSDGLEANVEGVTLGDAEEAELDPKLAEAIKAIAAMDDGVRLSHGEVGKLIGLSKTSVYKVAKGQRGEASDASMILKRVGLEFDGEKWVKSEICHHC